MKRKVLHFTAFTLTFLVSLFALWYWNSYKTDDSRIEKSKTWQRILSFEGKDLRSLNNDQSIRLFNDFYKMVDKNLYVGFGNSVLFRKFANEKNQIRYVLIGGADFVDENSYEKLSFQIFDQDGEHLNSREIEMKLPFSPDTVKFTKLPGFGIETIEVTCKPEVPENYAEQLTYALIGNDIQLIKSVEVIE